MTALVQTYQQQTISLPYHPSSPSSKPQFSSPPSGLSSSYSSRQTPVHQGPPSNPQIYRGGPTFSPVASYAFPNDAPPFLRRDHRSLSAPLMSDSFATSSAHALQPTLNRHQPTASASSSSTISSKELPHPSQQYFLHDHVLEAGKSSAIVPVGGLPVGSAAGTTELEAISPAAQRPSERLNRMPLKFDQATQPVFDHGESAIGSLPSQRGGSMALHSFAPFGSSDLNLGAGIHTSQSLAMLSRTSGLPKNTTDDMPIYRRPALIDPSTRDRRRSLGSTDVRSHTDPSTFQTQLRHSGNPARPTSMAVPKAEPRQIPFISTRSEAVPVISQAQIKEGDRTANQPGRQSSNKDSDLSNVVSPKTSSVMREESPSRITIATAQPVERQGPRLIDVPARGSSDMSKRLINPSPLSRPVETPPVELPPPVQRLSTPEASPATQSPAVQRLAALGDSDKKKGGKSRLRRAFSFGSAAELRRVTAENNMYKENAPTPTKLTKQRPVDDDLENDPVSKRQEAGGLGKGIYSGQGNYFTGSTDNLSISSTASSASMMMRKMGRGVKKGSRSLVGLFRPKSVIGVPPMNSVYQGAGVGEVSIVNVEAEREKVNVNVNLHDHVGGGTGFPRLERNSIEAGKRPSESKIRGSLSSDTNRSRRSFVGTQGERAQVLAAIKKGILKRNGTGTGSGQSSPSVRVVDGPSSIGSTPFGPPAMDTPRLSQPGTPGDERPGRLGHKRTGSVPMEDDGYFANLPKLLRAADETDPSTAITASTKFNVKFSPRIEFHETWPSLEYDRRGEIATCNKLTPMLAAQIKEELNTFKMEMEVHEHSKVYTHFF